MIIPRYNGTPSQYLCKSAPPDTDSSSSCSSCSWLESCSCGGLGGLGTSLLCVISVICLIYHSYHSYIFQLSFSLCAGKAGCRRRTPCLSLCARESLLHIHMAVTLSMGTVLESGNEPERTVAERYSEEEYCVSMMTTSR